jgi:hypothetical protein
MEEKIMLNSNEKLARSYTGLESNAKHFVVNGESADKILKRETQSKFNVQVDDYIQKFDTHAERLNEYVKNFKDSLPNMEIKAINNNMLVKPFNENPFQRITVSDSGIITDLGGQAPIYKSNETGEYEEEESYMHVGEVVDAGPECKWIKDGDVVYFTKASEVPVPFFKQGLVMINETRVTAVINEGLTARFKEKQNK